MSPVQLSTASAEQADQIASLVSEVYQPFASDFAPTALRWTADKVADDHVDWLVAASDGQIVGAVHHLGDPEGYTLDALAVHAERRRERIGSALVAEVERRAGETGAAQMIIALRRSLGGNAAFFGAHGYRVVRPFGAEHDVYTKRLGVAG